MYQIRNDIYFGLIGNLIFSQGYQVKTLGNAELVINGFALEPENNPITLTTGWNMISYLRNSPADAGLVFLSIIESNNLVIAKDNQGNAFLPEWNFNGIGNLLSGEGYQMKVIDSQELLYLSNDLEY